MQPIRRAAAAVAAGSGSASITLRALRAAGAGITTAPRLLRLVRLPPLRTTTAQRAGSTSTASASAAVSHGKAEACDATGHSIASGSQLYSECSDATSAPSSAPPVFTGPFAATRRLLDYTWHAPFPPERQQVQDDIIEKYLATAPPAQRLPAQWMVFSCGAMGAGKSHTLRYLSKVGSFPLESFLVVDSDRVKDALPELPRFLAEDPATAHTRLHRESAFIAEIIEREALLRGINVVHDGSLRDADWYGDVIVRRRAEFPRCRMAIIMVTASPAVVHARAERRARITGRVVPPPVLDASLQQVPRSFERLRHLVDFSATLDNDAEGAPPVVLPPHTLESLAAVWAHTPPPGTGAGIPLLPPAVPAPVTAES